MTQTQPQPALEIPTLKVLPTQLSKSLGSPSSNDILLVRQFIQDLKEKFWMRIFLTGSPPMYSVDARLKTLDYDSRIYVSIQEYGENVETYLARVEIELEEMYNLTQETDDTTITDGFDAVPTEKVSAEAGLAKAFACAAKPKRDKEGAFLDAARDEAESGVMGVEDN